MQILEGLTDAEIAEAHRSAEVFTEIEAMTAPLNTFLSLVQAFEWLNIRDRDDQEALFNYFSGTFGDPVDVASGKSRSCKRPGMANASPTCWVRPAGLPRRNSF